MSSGSLRGRSLSNMKYTCMFYNAKYKPHHLIRADKFSAVTCISYYLRKARHLSGLTSCVDANWQWPVVNRPQPTFTSIIHLRLILNYHRIVSWNFYINDWCVVNQPTQWLIHSSLMGEQNVNNVAMCNQPKQLSKYIINGPQLLVWLMHNWL